jgi:hypothetical protein
MMAIRALDGGHEGILGKVNEDWLMVDGRWLMVDGEEL